MTDESLRSTLRKNEEILEQVLDENRQWRVAVISKLADNTPLVEQIFRCVREGGLPDEYVEWHLFQVAKDRDRWKRRALDAEEELKEFKPEPRPPMPEPICVDYDEFHKDPLAWFRKASTEQRVYVMRNGKLSLSIGGRLT